MRKRALFTGVLVTLAVSGVVMPPGAAQSDVGIATPGYQVPSPEWADCQAGDGIAVCATVEVPLDWSKPRADKIKIGVVRRPAKDPGKRIGVLIVNFGGPGSRNVFPLQTTSPFSEAINERFDLVGFDPRGVHTSAQVRCDRALVQRSQDQALLSPTTKADFDELVSVNGQLMDSCREITGDLVDHTDTRHVVRDMDAIRAALGERKLTYVGFSYGTMLGQQYAEQFPHRVRAMVNDGNLDHSVMTMLDFMRPLAAAEERSFLAFVQWCEEAPACALHGQDVKKLYGELREKVKEGKVNFPGSTVPAHFNYLTGQLSIFTRQPRLWGSLAEWLVSLREGTGETLRTNGEAAETVNARATLWCGDWRLPIAGHAEYERLRETLALEYPNVQWSLQFGIAAGCVGEPLPTTNPQHRLKIKGGPPLVMIGNRYDKQTPYEWTRSAAEQSGSHLITYEGWGHTAYANGESGPESQCVDDAVNAYLIDLKVPRRGLSCPAVEQPPSP
jgi:pimeloyl-ACP methyl ester carboxylesterase